MILLFFPTLKLIDLDKNKSLLFDKDSESFSSGYKWQEAGTVWDIVDAVFNLTNSLHMIRPYSYEANALGRGLHQVRYELFMNYWFL